jgi:hypothetical protein
MSTKITFLYYSSSLLKLLQMNGGRDVTYGTTQIRKYIKAVAKVSSSYDTKIYTSLPQKLGFLELNMWISIILQTFHPKTTVMLLYTLLVITKILIISVCTWESYIRSGIYNSAFFIKFDSQHRWGNFHSAPSKYTLFWKCLTGHSPLTSNCKTCNYISTLSWKKYAKSWNFHDIPGVRARGIQR